MVYNLIIGNNYFLLYVFENKEKSLPQRDGTFLEGSKMPKRWRPFCAELS